MPNNRNEKEAQPDMQAVILAGGPPTRLHPLDTSVPKPMLPLFDRPLMEHTIELLAKHGVEDIIVAASHEAGQMIQYFGDGRSFGVKIRYTVETDPLGTAGALRLARDMISGTFLLISGDAITDFDVSAALHSHRSASAIATLLVSDVEDPTPFGCVELDPDGRVRRLLEKPTSAEAFTNTVSAGIYILEPEALSSIPPYQPSDLTREILPRMLNNREPVFAFQIPGYWCDAGHMLYYRRAHFDALEGKLDLDLSAVHIGDGVWMGDRVEIDPTVEISGPVYLGSGTVVRRNVALGERTIIGEDALIDEGAHISRSIIGGNSFIGKESVVSNCIIGGGYYVEDSDQLHERTLISHIQYERAPAPYEPARSGDRAVHRPSQMQKVAA